MGTRSSVWFENILCCPDCRSQIEYDGAFECKQCGFLDKTGRDLRQQRGSRCELSLPRKYNLIEDIELRQINITRPDIEYKGPQDGRDSRELMTEIMRNVKSRGIVLDLGCGPRDQYRSVIYLGHQYIGIDFSGDSADILADAHSLPFLDQSFNCVLSYAVLEHLHNPFIAVSEIERVLKPGGVFIGTVSQGEPFHASYFHHTAWGIISLISTTNNLKIKRLWASMDTLRSLSTMGRYSRIIKWTLLFIDAINRYCPWLAPRKMKWNQIDKVLDEIYRAGSIAFVIEKVA